MALKKQFNAIKYQEFPWLKDIHRDAYAQPFAHLQKAWARYVQSLNEENAVGRPQFKKKGLCCDH